MDKRKLDFYLSAWDSFVWNQNIQKEILKYSSEYKKVTWENIDFIYTKFNDELIKHLEKINICRHMFAENFIIIEKESFRQPFISAVCKISKAVEDTIYKDKYMIDNFQKELSRRYKSDLKATTKYLKDTFGKDIIIHHKMSYDFFQKRTRAYLNYVSYIGERCGRKYEYIDIQKELSFICSMQYVTNLDILNNYFNVSCAIAIYILDSINDSGHLSEAIEYILSERKLLQKIELPKNFHYPLYSDELIKGVIFLIKNRKRM